MPSETKMTTFYVASQRAPAARTRVKARGIVAAKLAYLRLKDHTVTVAKSTGQPVYHGTPKEQARAQALYASLLLWTPTRRGRNPPLVPAE